MKNIGARSYHNGIDFYEAGSHYQISVRRNEDDNITVQRVPRTILFVKHKQWDWKIFAVCILFSFIYSVCSTIILKVLAILAFLWGLVLLHYRIHSYKQENEIKYRYHAAEHKALNYYQKYKKATLDCDAVMKMSSFSVVCGSTAIAVVLILLTFLSLGITIIPFLIGKILWAIACFPAVFYLWGTGRCNFLQKYVLRTPTWKEVEVATRGLWECVHSQKG